MSNVSSLSHAQLTGLYGQYSQGSLTNQLSKSSGSSASSLSSAASSMTNAYSQSDPSGWVKGLQSVLKAMGLSEQSSVTFKDLLSYRDSMQAEFQKQVNADLKALGVGLDAEAYTKVRTERLYDAIDKALTDEDTKLAPYTLEADGNGGVTVKSDNPETAEAVKKWLDEDPARAAEFTRAQNPTRADMREYRTSLAKDMQSVLEGALKAAGLPKDSEFHMKTNADGSVTVTSDNAKVQSTIQSLFEENPDLETMYNDLESLTNSEAVDFSLVADGKGGVKVVSSHPDKDLIQAYFDTYDDMVDDFNAIDSLTKLDEARKAQKFDVTEARKRVQMESLSMWFGSSGASTSSVLSYTNGNASLYASLNKVV